MVIACVVPFLDEERHLPAVLESFAAQSRPPDELLLLDDGSTDGSGEVARAFAEAHPWARYLRRPPRPPERDRLATAAEYRSFQWGVEQLEPGWDAVGKVDADIRLTPATLAAIERELEADDRLGLVGAYIEEPGRDGVTRRKANRPEHVEGATKFYRRACWEQIDPVPPILGWDTIDEARARVHGWSTRSIEVPGGDPLHLRPMGMQDGLLRAYRRWGACGYAYGAHPLFVLLNGVRRMGERPLVLGGLNYLGGYGAAAAARAPRAEPAERELIRREQLARLRGRLSRTEG